MNEYQIQYEWIKGKEYTNRIKNFLTDIDDFIIPKLSIRVDIDEYSKKLARKAYTLFAVYEDEDIGSCSIYCNTNIAYISSIAVKNQFLNMHIGTHIMLNVQNKALINGCKIIRLDVFRENTIAILFYEKCKFHKIERSNDWITMEWRYSDGK